MATTLKITVDYDSSNNQFSFTPSYTDASGTYTAAAVSDQGTIMFINSGSYSGTLQNAALTPSTVDPEFDSVSVVLGSSLVGHDSSHCRKTDRYELSIIQLPALDCSVGHSWCQQVPKSKRFKDPKLGLSNARGNTPVSFDFSSWRACNCAAGSESA